MIIQNIEVEQFLMPVDKQNTLLHIFERDLHYGNSLSSHEKLGRVLNIFLVLL